MPSKPFDLRDRTFEFSCAVLRWTRSIYPRSGIDGHLATQLLKSATSIGANVEEAKAAYSRREFAHKSAIALKEARETFYWLKILESESQADSALGTLRQEADELVAILTATVRTARRTQIVRNSAVALLLSAILTAWL